MPTFESIPLDAALKRQLLEPPNPDGVSISTPQALLSRTPQALADQLLGNKKRKKNISNEEMLQQMDTLRSQVAHSMMAQTIMGKFRLQQQQLYDDGMMTVQQQQSQNSITTSSTDRHQYDYYATRPLILGATVNVMQAWQQEQERKGSITSLSTGCRAMDELLALPSEYSSISHTQYTNQAQSNQQPQPQEHSHPPGGIPGLPRGHLLCFSGLAGSGKSQWCLQLATQAIRRYYKTFPSAIVRYCYSSAGHNGHALAQRLSQLLQYQVSPMASSSSSSILSRALEKIEFQPIQTMTELVATLKALEEELLEALRYGNSQANQTPLLLVVDSISNLDAQANPSLQVSRIYRNLKRLARQYSLWIVVTEAHGQGAGDYQVECQSVASTTTASTVTTTLQATVNKHPTELEPKSITLFHTPSGMSTRASPAL